MARGNVAATSSLSEILRRMATSNSCTIALGYVVFELPWSRVFRGAGVRDSFIIILGADGCFIILRIGVVSARFRAAAALPI